MRWESEPPFKRPAMTAPLLAGDALYFCGHDRYVYCLERASGQRRWAQQLPRMSQTRPLLIDGLLYVAAQDRRVYALDPASGDVAGEPVLQTAGKVETDWASDGRRIFLGDREGHIYCLAAAAQELAADPQALEQEGRWADAATLHALAGNLLRAGDIYSQQLQESFKAGQLYEQAGELAQAAVQYEAAGRWKEARRRRRELGHAEDVARLSELAGELLPAAQAYQEAGRWGEAGRLYEGLQKWPEAASMYEQAGAAAQQAAGDGQLACQWWAQAADAYRASGQPEKAVQLYKRAGQTEKAEDLITSTRDTALGLFLERLLYGGVALADRLAVEKRFVPAAEEYLHAGKPAEAARMYEQANEYALAGEHYRAAGQMGDAARMMAQAGNWGAAANLYGEAGDLAASAAAYGKAANHLAAAQAYEALSDWRQAAGHWQALERWERAAQAWSQAGELAQAATAWLRCGSLLQAAEGFCQAAEALNQAEMEQSEAAAGLYEQAMQAFSDYGDLRRARDCDVRRRYLRQQPLLEVSLIPLAEYLAGEAGRLEVLVRNAGWGTARQITFAVTGQFEALHQEEEPFNLGPDLEERKPLYIAPLRAGQALPLTFAVAYSDPRGASFPSLCKTFDIVVRDKAAPADLTPRQIHVQGDMISVERIEEWVAGDQVKVDRRRGAIPAETGLLASEPALIECSWF